MGLAPIPNQPINLSPYVIDDCQGDSKQYATLFNTDDILYVQFINNPCSGEQFCDPSFSGTLGDVVTVSNSTFDSDLSDWSAGARWTWDASGGALLTYGTGSSVARSIFQDLFILIPGMGYRVTFTIRDYTSTSGLEVAVFVGEGTPQLVSANGTYSLDIICGASTTLRFMQNAGTDGSLILDGIIVTTAIGCITTIPAGWEVGVGGMYHEIGTANQITISSPVLVTGYYKVTVTVENMNAGTLSVYFGAILVGTITSNTTTIFYDLATAGDNLKFTPSSEFDGTITGINIFELKRDYTCDVIDLTAASVWDLVAEGNVIYVKDRVVIAVQLSEGDVLDTGCFAIKVYDPCTSTTYISNYFEVKEEHDCAKLIVASGTGTTHGFLWGGFSLSHRVRFIKFSPEYPIDADDYEFSDGSRYTIFAKREKYYTGLLDIADENFHDTLSTQIICENFAIDGVSYFVKPENYKPDWNKDGRNNLAQARIELRKRTGTIYSK